MLVSEVPVAVLETKPISLRCNKPLIIIMEGILGIGKSVATAYWCIGKPQQPGLQAISLGDQTPDFEPLYVNVDVKHKKGRFWYVEEGTLPLEEYYAAIARYTKGIDKEPSEAIVGFQYYIMGRRLMQAETIIPEMIEKRLCPVVDRSPWGDAYVFAQNLINMGAIRGDSLKNYENFRDKALDAWDNMIKSLGAELVVVYLLAENPEMGKYPEKLLEATQTTAEIAFKRRGERNRLAEKSVTPDYMYRLNDLQNDLFGRNPSFSSGQIVRVNTGLSSEVNPEEEIALLEDIARGMHKKGLVQLL